MSRITGEPFEPLGPEPPGPPRRLRWWQAALILAPFVALVVFSLLYGK